jgi:hypothetical protein
MKVKITKYKNDVKRIGDIPECVINHGVKTKNKNTRQTSKHPRKSLDERIAEALTKALKPVLSRLDNIVTRLDSIEFV